MGTADSTPAPKQVRKAEPAEWRKLGKMLADAFQDDPVWLWIAPDQARRQKHLESMFSHVIRSRVIDGLGYTTDSLEGAAIWAEPGKWRTTTKESLRILAPAYRTIGPGPLRRAAKALATIERIHPSEPHWYLEFLASRVDLRGRGFGSAVLQPMLDRCDFEAMPAYLESSKLENIPFYERFGFKVVEEFSIGEGGPLMWTMWRDPLDPR